MRMPTLLVTSALLLLASVASGASARSSSSGVVTDLRSVSAPAPVNTIVMPRKKLKIVSIPVNPTLKPRGLSKTRDQMESVDPADRWLSVVQQRQMKGHPSPPVRSRRRSRRGRSRRTSGRGGRVGRPSARDRGNFYAAYTAANMAANLPSANPFLDAFLRAYNNHEDVLVSPNDVWLVIQLQFSKFVNSNAEAMRTIFVHGTSSNKTELQVTDTVGESETDWPTFFAAMEQLVRSNLKTSVATDLQADFTTTGQIEKLLSSVVLLDTFQPFFHYSRMRPICSIRNVQLIGEEDDWLSLKEKLVALAALVPDSTFARNYTEPLLPVLDELIATYNGKPNTEYWNHIFDHTQGRDGSAGGKKTKISGWFLLFFGLDPTRAVLPIDVHLRSVHVPVTVINEARQDTTQSFVVGGFHGLRYDQSAHTYRPVMSVSVIIDQASTKRIKPKKKPTNRIQSIEPQVESASETDDRGL